MTLTPEQIAEAKKPQGLSAKLLCLGCGKDNLIEICGCGAGEAHGADAEPARPTPFPADYSELVWDADGWSQTIIVDGKRPEWLRDDDLITSTIVREAATYSAHGFASWWVAIRVRRREPKRETVKGWLCQMPAHIGATPVTYDLLDGEPDLSTLKIAEGAL